MKQVKRVKWIIVLLCISSLVHAQNAFIFKGGSADGWVSRNTVQGSSNIFHGGNADGWSSQNFTQASGNIYHGGIADGWSSQNYIQSATNLFKGGSGDGWDSKNYLQSNLTIFHGGQGDGWDSKNTVQANFNIFFGGGGDGWASTYRPQGPLPVTLIYFNASKNSPTSSLLSWQTSQETNSSHFDVERSNDAVAFSKIGTVGAAGNSSLAISYSFIDNNPLSGMNYYRLKQVDLDGHFIYTPARLVRFEELNAATVKYYPNPTKNILTIELSAANATEARVINIINAAGAVVNQFKIGSGAGLVMHVDLSHYAKGIYFIQLHTATLNSTERIVLE